MHRSHWTFLESKVERIKGHCNSKHGQTSLEITFLYHFSLCLTILIRSHSASRKMIAHFSWFLDMWQLLLLMHDNINNTYDGSVFWPFFKPAPNELRDWYRRNVLNNKGWFNYKILSGWWMPLCEFSILFAVRFEQARHCSPTVTPSFHRFCKNMHLKKYLKKISKLLNIINK